MSLNIKNEAVHDLVRRLAELTGQSQTHAVEDAVRRRLAELTDRQHQRKKQKLTRIRELVAEYNRNLAPGPSYPEMMDELYDDQGMPR